MSKKKKKYTQKMSEHMSLTQLNNPRTKKGGKNDMSKEEQFLDAYERLAGKVFRRILFKTSRKEIAKDLTQEVFAKTWDYMIRKGKDVRYINSFIYTVTSNLIKDYYKKKKSIPMGAMENYDSHTIPGVDNTVQEAEIAHIQRALNEMHEPYRSVIRMRLFEGKTPSEIAAIMGERSNTISVRLHRGLKMFRDILVKKEKKNEGQE